MCSKLKKAFGCCSLRAGYLLGGATQWFLAITGLVLYVIGSPLHLDDENVVMQAYLLIGVNILPGAAFIPSILFDTFESLRCYAITYLTVHIVGILLELYLTYTVFLMGGQWSIFAGIAVLKLAFDLYMFLVINSYAYLRKEEVLKEYHRMSVPASGVATEMSYLRNPNPLYVEVEGKTNTVW